MKLPNLKVLISVFLFAFFLIPQASAQSPVVQNTQNTTVTRPQTGTAPGGTLQSKALMEIEKRIDALTLAQTRIEQTTGLSPEAKQALVTGIQEEITNLNSLKTQITAEDDATAMGTLVASIVASYRNYALLVPKTMILSTAERLMIVADKMSMIQERILTTVTTSANGQDITEIETLLTDAQENIMAGRESAQAAMEKVAALEPAGYPGNRATLQQARADLVAARTSLSAARASLGEALTAWQALSSDSASTDPQGMVDSPTTTQTRTSVSPVPSQASSGSEAL